MSFVENYFFDAIGEETYTETLKFPFRCNIVRFNNDKVRLLFMVPVNDANYAAEFSNDSPSRSGRQNLSLEERRQVTLLTTVDYRATIKIVPEPDTYMKGLRSFVYLFTSFERTTHPNKYNNWNFTNAQMWDSIDHENFFFSNETSIVFNT